MTCSLSLCSSSFGKWFSWKFPISCPIFFFLAVQWLPMKFSLVFWTSRNHFFFHLFLKWLTLLLFKELLSEVINIFSLFFTLNATFCETRINWEIVKKRREKEKEKGSLTQAIFHSDFLTHSNFVLILFWLKLRKKKD